MQPLEELHLVPSFPAYAVTQEGNVYSSRRGRWKIMMPRINKAGYMQVVFSINKSQHTRLVHRLVLEAFIGPAPDGEVACHNDGNRLNNNINNLRWDTYKSNTADMKKHGTQFRPLGEKCGTHVLTEDQVRSVFVMRQSGMLHREIAAVFGVSNSAIKLILNGKNWPHLGLVKQR